MTFPIQVCDFLRPLPFFLSKYVQLTICLETNMYALNLEEGSVIQSNIVPIEISFSI